jgi:hypothetical protein
MWTPTLPESGGSGPRDPHGIAAHACSVAVLCTRHTRAGEYILKCESITVSFQSFVCVLGTGMPSLMKRSSSCSQDVSRKYNSRDVQLSQIDSDIRLLYSRAKETYHLNPQQIRLAAEPLLKFTEKRKCNFVGAAWLTVAVVICILTSTLCHEPSYRFVCAYARLFFIEVCIVCSFCNYALSVDVASGKCRR